MEGGMEGERFGLQGVSHNGSLFLSSFPLFPTSHGLFLFQLHAECPLSLPPPSFPPSLSPPIPPSSLSLSPIPGSCHSDGVVSVVAAIVAVCAKAKIHPITPLLSYVNREENGREKERIFGL